MNKPVVVLPLWRTEIKDGAAIIFFNIADKKQNILTTESMAELDRLLDHIPRDVTGLVIASGKDSSFIAGADISEIDSITDAEIAKAKAREGQRIFNKITSLSIPTVAAINGYCLGGGCELALACTYRVAALGDKVLIGLPETKLGILPGFGGTQRLPKIVGIRKATELILSGKLLDAKAALKIGLVDRACSSLLLLQTAIEILHDHPRPAAPRLSLSARIIESRFLRQKLLDKALAEAEKRAKGFYPAIPATIDVLKRTVGLPCGKEGVSEEGLEIEAEAFSKLVLTEVSRNLRFLYFLDDAQKKYAPYKSTPSQVRRAAAIGAGVMGGGIAWAFSSRGIPVRITDVREEALLGALRAADSVYGSDVKRRKISRQDAMRGMSRIAVGLDQGAGPSRYDGFGISDIVVEAVVERMDIKKQVLADVESRVRTETILATNTSGLSIDEMASALKRPEKFGGLHFFNPVHRMPLVEIIRGAATSDTTIATLFAVARSLGKTPILVKDSPGFLVNRILIPYMLEAARMFEEGVSVETVDQIAEAFGMPMGPFRLADEVGIDIGLHVSQHLEASFGERMKVPEILKKMVTGTFLGKKNGKGFYIHEREARGKDVSPEINREIRFLAPADPRDLPMTEIEDRLFFTMFFEALRCLDDGVVARPDDIEIGMIYGAGFPAFRGGILRWGASLGYAGIVKRASSLKDKYGDRYLVPDGLKRLLLIE